MMSFFWGRMRSGHIAGGRSALGAICVFLTAISVNGEYLYNNDFSSSASVSELSITRGDTLLNRQTNVALGGRTNDMLQITHTRSSGWLSVLGSPSLSRKVTKAVIEYGAYFSDGEWQFRLQGKMPGLQPDSPHFGGNVNDPVVWNKWSVRLMWISTTTNIRNGNDNRAQPSVYIYDQDRATGSYGKHHRVEQYYFDKDKWYDIRMEVQLNTHTGSTANRDGVVKLYINGQLEKTVSGLKLVGNIPSGKSIETAHISKVAFHNYYGGNKNDSLNVPTTSTSRCYFDYVRVETEPESDPDWFDAVAYTAESHPDDENTIRSMGTNLGYIKDGSWVCYESFDFGSGANGIVVSASSRNDGGTIEVRTGAPDGELYATVDVASTGDWDAYQEFGADFAHSPMGAQDLYFVFRGGELGLMNLRSFKLVPLDIDNPVMAAQFDAESHPLDDAIIRKESSYVSYIKDGSWIRFDSFDFESRVGGITLSAASQNDGGTVEFRIDAPDGPLIGAVETIGTGGWQAYQTFSGAITSGVSGVHDLYLTFTGGNDSLLNLKSFTIHSEAMLRMEAEEAIVINGTVKNHAGASGADYVDGAAGLRIEWNVTSVGGMAELRFSVKVPSGTRSMGVFVNGIKEAVITTTSSSWSDEVLMVSLLPGNNTIELRDSEGTAELDVDCLLFQPYSEPELVADFDSGHGRFTFSWAGAGLKLQVTTNGLSEAVWRDVPGGESSPTNHQVSNEVANAFFRLVPVSE